VCVWILGIDKVSRHVSICICMTITDGWRWLDCWLVIAMFALCVYTHTCSACGG
jgi:hypothetical protein